MYKILSINGGGARGYISARVLSYIEQKLGRPLKESFNLVVGTSSGSFLLAGMDYLPVTYLPNLMRETLASKLFKKNLFSFNGFFRTKYNTEKKIEAISDIIADKNTCNNFDYAIVAYDIISGNPIIFNSMEEEKGRNYILTKKYKLLDALISSSAAPLFWNPYPLDNMLLVDGVIAGATDPTDIAVKLALNKERNLNDLLIVNIAAGNSSKSYNFRSGANHFKWAIPILNMLMNGQPAATSMLYFNEDIKYYNLDIDLIFTNDAIDDISKENFDGMDQDYNRLIFKHQKDIDKIITYL